MVGKIHSRKADQAAKPGIATVHEWCTSVAISWAKKVELAKCDTSVGFPKSSHIYVYVCTSLLTYILRLHINCDWTLENRPNVTLHLLHFIVSEIHTLPGLAD